MFFAWTKSRIPRSSSLAATASNFRCGEAVIEVGRAEDVDTAPG
jgi:hypothetical protein